MTPDLDVAILTQAPGVLGDHVLERSEGTQAIHVRVHAPTVEAEVMVVSAHHQPLSLREQELLAQHLGARISKGAIVFITHQDTGKAQASIYEWKYPAFPTRYAAAAITVIMRNWAWDESPSFDVAIGEEHFALEVHDAGAGHWVVRDAA